MSYLNGEETRYGTAGSVRPDFVSPDKRTTSFEVKAKANLMDRFPSSMVYKFAMQAIARAIHLPQGMIQKAAIDITGQILTDERKNAIRAAIVKKSGGLISWDNILFFGRD